jgi:hypothetical protein
MFFVILEYFLLGEKQARTVELLRMNFNEGV